MVANKTKIEWCDYTINPIKGRCKTGCPYCYATRMYDRYKWNPEVRLDLGVFDRLGKLPPSRIFVCSTHEIFGEWIPREWIEHIYAEAAQYPEHTFIFLTKNPARSVCLTPYPNFWMGTTITRKSEMGRWQELKCNHPAAVNFVSFEPLLEDIGSVPANANWVIAGAETGNRKDKVTPKPEWFEAMAHSCRANRIPMFIKDNVRKFFDDILVVQDWPVVK